MIESLKVLLQGQVTLSLLTSSTALHSDASTLGCHTPQRIPFQRKAAVSWASRSIPLDLEAHMVSFPHDKHLRLRVTCPGGALHLLVH